MKVQLFSTPEFQSDSIEVTMMGSFLSNFNHATSTIEVSDAKFTKPLYSKA